MKRQKNITLRRAGQWILVFILAYFWIKAVFFNDTLFDFEACCPFGGLQAITTFLVNGALACSMEGMQVIMGGLLVLATILFSKLFCGYVCPIGTVSEGLSRLGKKLKLPKFEIKGVADYLLRSLKYILLFITFYFTLGSNDLFCKKFDPFFAIASRFGEDVSTLMALSTITLLIVGAILLRQFWCRYLCPLGAISSAVKYAYVFIVFAIIVIVLNKAGIELDLTLILAIVAGLAYLFEIIGLRKKAGIQVLKVTRNEHICIDCGLCDKKCPQGIKVSKMKQVNHPDCNLCMECMGNCPNEEAIGLNGSTKFRWLPVLITVVFVMAGFILGTKTTIPTVDLKWGTKEELARSRTFEMAGLKNVKCYGSSMAFVEDMKKVRGITGAATYIRDHKVILQYDTTLLTPALVRRSLFTPKHFDIREPANEAEVFITDFYIENFFDQMDVMFLANLCKNDKNIFGFKTFYGEPVKVRLFTSENFDADSVKSIIEGSDLIYTTAEESFSSKDLYTVSQIEKSDTILSGLYLKSMSFPQYRRVFNNRSQYSNDQLASLVFPITEYPRNQQLMQFVVNHLGKADQYIVGLISKYTANGPIAIVFYVKDKTTPENVAKLVTSKTITVHYNNGIKEQLNNPYKFELPEGIELTKEES